MAVDRQILMVGMGEVICDVMMIEATVQQVTDWIGL
jgi:hypothetical protein